MSTLFNVCPSETTLEQYLLGRLPNELTDRIDHHIDGCERCPSRVGGLKLESRLMTVLNTRPPKVPAELTDRLDELMARLENLVQSGPQDNHSDSVIFDFLEPPQFHGELGRLGTYRVLELLDRGGMGYVFRAEDTKLKRMIGLKVMRESDRLDDSRREMFLREARAMAAVKHDRVAVIHDVSIAHNGTPYFTMELLRGESLEHWMRRNERPDLATILRIGREAAEGLSAAHATGLIHRDIKPSNLWLEETSGTSRIKLIDFGLAATIEHDDATVGGTPGYIAPEQLSGEPLDPRADLFSLGCVLYQLCTGKHPFPGRGLTRSFVVKPVSITSRNIRIPAVFAKLIERMVARDPSDRPSSADDVVRQMIGIKEKFIARRISRLLPYAVSIATTVTLCAIGFLLLRPERSPSRENVQTESRIPIPTATAPTIHDIKTSVISNSPRPFADPEVGPSLLLGPPDDDWCAMVASLEPRTRLKIVSEKIKAINPHYKKAGIEGWFDGDTITNLMAHTTGLTDLRPVRAFQSVHFVRFSGNNPGQGDLTDLTPLQGMKIDQLYLFNNRELRDLRPIRNIEYETLDISNTAVESLEFVNGRKLVELKIQRTPITDLTLLKAMPNLTKLNCRGCRIASFESLVGGKIAELYADFDLERDIPIIKKMTTLTKINGKTARNFWFWAEDELKKSK